MEKAITEVIKKLCENIKDENREVVSEIVSILEGTNYDFKNPETFYVVLMFQIHQIMDSVAEIFHELSSDNYKVNFIFTNYNFLESNIEKLIEEKTGTSMYVADKSRHIISLYLKYLLTEEIPEDEFRDDYWLVNFGTNKQWMEFCNSLYKLYYGNPKEYFNVYNILLKEEIRKYEKTLYSLIFVMNDEEEVLVDQRFDKEPELPETISDCYIIRKTSFKNKKDYNEPKSLGGFLNKFYYLVPTSDIYKTIIKSEKIFV